MAEMWTRSPIMQGNTEQHQLALISQLCGSITPEVRGQAAGPQGPTGCRDLEVLLAREEWGVEWRESPGEVAGGGTGLVVVRATRAVFRSHPHRSSVASGRAFESLTSGLSFLLCETTKPVSGLVKIS